jgi:hypothetical protein
MPVTIPLLTPLVVKSLRSDATGSYVEASQVAKNPKQVNDSIAANIFSGFM